MRVLPEVEVIYSSNKPELYGGSAIPAVCLSIASRGMVPLDLKRLAFLLSRDPDRHKTIVTLLKKPILCCFERTSPLSARSSAMLRVAPYPNTVW